MMHLVWAVLLLLVVVVGGPLVIHRLEVRRELEEQKRRKFVEESNSVKFKRRAS